MIYGELVSRLREGQDFQRTVELLDDLGKRFRALNFSHNDVDGVCCAFLIKRTLERFFGAEVVSVMPPSFMLTVEEVREIVNRTGDFDLLVISDKGTFGSYDRMTGVIKRVLVIDHHQPQGYPDRCTVLNPKAETGKFMPASALVCHLLMSMLGKPDDVDDLVAAIGCRGDLAFDIVDGFCDEMAEPFMQMVREKFPVLFEPVEDEPTIFDRAGRRKTSLISQMAEAVHAGTLAHLYAEEIGEVGYGPDLVLNLFEEIVGGRPPASLEEFLSGETGRVIMSVYKKFREDCTRLEDRVKDPIFLGKIGKTEVLLVFARELKRAAKTTFSAILPFVAFSHIRGSGRSNWVLIVFCPKDAGTQISMRAEGTEIDCASFLSELARRLASRYRGERIGGGGHKEAAGFFAPPSVPVYAVLHEMVFLLEEMLTEPAV